VAGFGGAGVSMDGSSCCERLATPCLATPCLVTTLCFAAAFFETAAVGRHQIVFGEPTLPLHGGTCQEHIVSQRIVI